MQLIEHYRGTHADQALAFADGGLPDLMRYLSTTRGRFISGGPTDDYRGRGRDWVLHASWDDALRMARDGWHDGAAQIARGFPAPTFGAASRKPKWGFAVAGDLPDVGRYLSGHPDAMRRRKADRGRAPVAVLYIANGVRENISAGEYTHFGIAVCEMIDALENSGTRVELNQLTRAATGGDPRFVVTGWRVKEAAEPLDLSTVAFTYMHPAAHRRLQFQLRARLTNSTGGSTYIAPADFPDAPDSALIIEGISAAAGECETMEGARDFLRGRINDAAGHELISEEMLEHLRA